MSAATIAEAVRHGEATASDIVAVAVARARRVQSHTNAVAVPLGEQAHEAARAIDRLPARDLPLAGVPVSVKESFEVAGTPASGGVEALAGRLSERDARVVAALRSAGAVVVTKGNLAQLLWFAESDNPVYGRTSNPWSPDRSPGGSSGGDAAIVASGVVPVAVGTDIGGSVRIPAHCCGVSALKPTAGRLSLEGSLDELLFAGLAEIRNQPGIFALDPRDIELVLGVLDAAAADRGGPRVAAASPAGVRVGVFDDNGVMAVSPSVRRAVAIAAKAAEAAGAEVVEFTPPGAAEALELFDAVFQADGGATLERLLAGGQAHPRVAAAIDGARRGALDVAGVAVLRTRIAAYRHRFSRALDEHGVDAVICPVYPVPAVEHGKSGDVVGGQSYSSLWNLLGFPAGVAPVTTVQEREEQASAGLPVGVQVAARPWREDLVLGLMSAIAVEMPPPTLV
ncbi:MAG: amidase [Gaiellales bacterium]|nr:amidase [Gaiellales bacterium]